MEKAKPFKVGEEIYTDYGRCTIVEYWNKKKVKVIFTVTGYETWTTSKCLREGNVRDWYAPSVYGIGVVGKGKYKSTVNNVATAEYRVWSDMLKRCYCPITLEKFPAYKEVEVSKGMRYLQDFGEWCQDQIGFGLKGWQLDKDILVKGNKLYDYDLCVFVPREINLVLTSRKSLRGDYPIGVYKQPSCNRFSASVSDLTGKSKYLGLFLTIEDAFNTYKQEKESIIKILAEKWKDEIDQRVYDALLKYEVDIND